MTMRSEMRNGCLVMVQDVHSAPLLADGKFRVREVYKGGYRFLCPGCGEEHTYRVGIGEPSWEFNGSLISPTFYPSLIDGRGSEHVCHFFVTNGHIEFERDCTHALAGKTLVLPEIVARG